MNQNVMTPIVETNLKDIWNSAKQESIIHFLRRAVQPEQTLAELSAVLRFASAEADLQHISLRDVLEATAPIYTYSYESEESYETYASPEPEAEVVPRVVRTRRPRRTAEDGENLKAFLLAELAKLSEGAIPSKLVARAQQAGQGVDVQAVNIMLGRLLKDDIVVCDHSRPKVWRLKPRGRSTPDPVIIRKAPRPADAVVDSAEQVAASPAPSPEPVATEAVRTTGLMTPEEIKAAAQALQQKFFAAQTRSS